MVVRYALPNVIKIGPREYGMATLFLPRGMAG